jgi:NitT/TauT family transport system permease protein
MDRGPSFWVGLLSFLLPLGLWALVSYVPFLWHPMLLIKDPGDLTYLQEGQYVERDLVASENLRVAEEGGRPATGERANPIYLPAPHRVAVALFSAFTTRPLREGEPWLHESLGHSIQVIFWGFLLSSLLGVPLGILCGSFHFAERLIEPFVEFFRYLPAPAFGALAVAILGIDEGPKIAIIFIGTFFQQILVLSATTKRFDPSLLEAGQTLGASRLRLLFRVIVPGILPQIYKDQRILLGWAWTYLIVAEVVGASSGISWFINQQAKYRIYENVIAAILIIGLIGLSTDVILNYLGRCLFPWTGQARPKAVQHWMNWWEGLPRYETRYERQRMRDVIKADSGKPVLPEVIG